tara:strand:- start:430 stop:651 length:222 start_codon:yes stop_codon:yes gene_type:complete
MKLIFVISGWLCIVAFSFGLKGFLSDGMAATKWGRMSGDSATVAVVIYGLATILFGGYAIVETFKYFKNRKIK